VKIAILSDTHGTFDDLIKKYLIDVDVIIHAGDWGGNCKVYDDMILLGKQIIGVFGNIDSHEMRLICPKVQYGNIEGLKLAMTHIAGNPNNYNPETKELLNAQKPDFFICGHSHIVLVKKIPQFGNLLHINPGAAGIHGFHNVRTLITCEIKDKKMSDMNLIELGPRTKS